MAKPRDRAGDGGDDDEGSAASSAAAPSTAAILRIPPCPIDAAERSMSGRAAAPAPPGRRREVEGVVCGRAWRSRVGPGPPGVSRFPVRPVRRPLLRAGRRPSPRARMALDNGAGGAVRPLPLPLSTVPAAAFVPLPVNASPSNGVIIKKNRLSAVRCLVVLGRGAEQGISTEESSTPESQPQNDDDAARASPP